jgi:uncharacterized membrane protein HdeD (DUF308 family)
VNGGSGPLSSHDQEGCFVIVLGLILLLIGLLAGIGLLVTFGIVLLVVGCVLVLVGSTGHALGGRRHYW